MDEVKNLINNIDDEFSISILLYIRTSIIEKRGNDSGLEVVECDKIDIN